MEAKRGNLGTITRIITGSIFSTLSAETGSVAIARLCRPLKHANGIVRCLSLTMQRMQRSQNMPIPQYPVVFPSPIPVPAIAQEPGLDYECELVVALDYVLGYAVGDDVSHREWQLKRGGGQWSIGKSFDGWAPFCPGIVTTAVIKDPQNLKLTTRVNGKVMQEGNTADMIFSVKKAISFLSQGTTLRLGDTIFTGTVAMGRSPQTWLKDGDAAVDIERIGTCKNTVKFSQRKIGPFIRHIYT
ncbi:hypothetical protein B0H63DRAFT_491732 [Podospora didyma]|uniref:Fumarylacetoacetase-like C-terminal domain-containing protein n=1 Tax=Podospora didyma TaxID=330526 RepID=A0AAE0P730_9PEZI|nr:hypothetical protein B0H63DRAFT_491732 [Podospora didyma]